ncbi:kin of IRRE-like protein 3 [Glandiceps talaboti]
MLAVVFFLEGQVKASFVVNPKDTLVIQGDSTHLDCTFTSKPPLYGWYMDVATALTSREALTGNGPGDYELVSYNNVYNLRIHNITKDDAGLYDCVDLTTRDEVEANLYVVTDKPECWISPGITVIEGEKVNLTCDIALDDNAPGDLVWYERMDKWIERHRHPAPNSTWSTEFSRDDNGAILNCRLEHETLPAWKWSQVTCENDILLDVQFSPMVYISQFPGSAVMEGDDYVASCGILEPGRPDGPYIISWFHENIDIQHDEDLLTISTINRTEGGEYTCVLANTFYNGVQGNGNATVSVDVQYLSLVNISLSSDIIIEGDPITIDCLAYDGNPDPYMMSLYFKELVIYEVEGTELTFEIEHGVPSSDSGIYQCRATTLFYDEARHSSNDIAIIIQYSPDIYETDDVHAKINETVSLVCTAEAVPPPSIVWYDSSTGKVIPEGISRENNGKSMRNVTTRDPDGKLVTSTLTVYRVSRSDFGEYICEAFNWIGSDTSVIVIREETGHMFIPRAQARKAAVAPETVHVSDVYAKPDKKKQVEQIPEIEDVTDANGRNAQTRGYDMKPVEEADSNNASSVQEQLEINVLQMDGKSMPQYTRSVFI